MSYTPINKPPVNVDANDFSFKKWFTQVYDTFSQGVMLPRGGVNTNLPTIAGGRRNLLRNGDFQIWQRGTSVSSTGGASDYTCDGWAITRAVGTEVVSRQTGAPAGFQYCVRVARSAADTGVATIYLSQAIESAFAIPAAGQPISLSFWARKGSGFDAAGSTNTTLEAKVDYGTGTDQGPLAAFTGSTNAMTIRPVLTTNWQYFSVTGVVLSTTATELKVYFDWTPSSTAAANNYIELAGVQLEVGFVPTAFEYQTFDQQLLLSQRYFTKSFVYGTAPAQNVGSAAGAALYRTKTAGATNDEVMVYLPNVMRSAPTVTFYNPAAANALWRNASRIADSGVASAFGTGDRSFAINNPQVALDAANQLCEVHWSATAEL